jgi:hypothetical protein
MRSRGIGEWGEWEMVRIRDFLVLSGDESLRVKGDVETLSLLG